MLATGAEADPARVAADRLGEPDAVYAVSPGRFWAKFALGTGLLVYGAVANTLAWQFGFWRLDHLTLLFVFAPMVTGFSLLRHLYSTRGLRVLVYPTGLFRVHRGAATAFPWDDLAAVGLRSEVAAPVVLSQAGAVTDAWFAPKTPVFRIGTAGLTLLRADGISATLSPALADYDELAELAQRATFRHLWPGVWSHLKAGGAVGLGGFTVDPEGVWVGNRGVPWGDRPEVKVGNKILTVSGQKKRVAIELEGVPNPHLLIGLIEAVRLSGPPRAVAGDGPDGAAGRTG